MSLELHIAGPGLDTTRRLAHGDAELVLGRDTECDVCLPDPERNVSRRHLALWVEAGELRFHVLSVVNGIEMPFGEAPPGARGVLPHGDTLMVGSYAVTAHPGVEDAVDDGEDPWAALHRLARAGAAAAAPSADEDPFGDWGFETTFGPARMPGALDAGSPAAADVSAFFRGLGMDAAAMTPGELEAMGRLVRVLVLGILDLHSEVGGVKQELRSEDRTMLAPRENNPLKADWPAETKLRYLFGGRLAAAGFIPPERAVREIIMDLIAHNAASGAAARAALEGTLREHAPAALKARLLGDGARLFEGTRAWDAFCRYYEEQGANMPQWVQRQLDRYFTEAYLRESLRIRRETPPRSR